MYIHIHMYKQTRPTVRPARPWASPSSQRPWRTAFGRGETLIELKFLKSSCSSSSFSIRVVRDQNSQFELFELILLLKLGKQLPVERFGATVSQSTVSSPPLLGMFPISMTLDEYSPAKKALPKAGNSGDCLSRRDTIYIYIYILLYIYIYVYMSLSIYIYMFI